MSDTPWTPAPWATMRTGDGTANVWTGTNPETHGAPLFSVYQPRGIGTSHAAVVYTGIAEAQLIALAPEMAAAILVWQNCDEMRCGNPEASCLCMDTLDVLADKLRAIGDKCDACGATRDPETGWCPYTDAGCDERAGLR